jgi:hypothetical protein
VSVIAFRARDPRDDRDGGPDLSREEQALHQLRLAAGRAALNGVPFDVIERAAREGAEAALREYGREASR